jgi:hypothetical protein
MFDPLLHPPSVPRFERFEENVSFESHNDASQSDVHKVFTAFEILDRDGFVLNATRIRGSFKVCERNPQMAQRVSYRDALPRVACQHAIKV